MKKVKESNFKLNWTLGTLLMVLPILALYFTNMSTYIDIFDPAKNKFVYENIGTAFLLLYIICALLLTAYQKMAYWPFISKIDRKQLDERQLLVRQRVFERSYIMLPILFILARVFTNEFNDRMQLVLWWVFGIGFFALPAIIGARQKDS